MFLIVFRINLVFLNIYIFFLTYNFFVAALYFSLQMLYLNILLIVIPYWNQKILIHNFFNIHKKKCSVFNGFSFFNIINFTMDKHRD